MQTISAVRRTSAAWVLVLAAGASAALGQGRPNPIFLQKSAWTNVGIGGGGAFFHPAGSPHDPKLIFVSSDMGGFYRSEDAGKTWRMLDWRNIVHSRSPIFHPTDPKVVFAVAWGGDTLKVSRDKGLLWALVGGASPPWAGDGLLALAIDRGSPKLMLLSGRKGLYRSTDGGAAWAAVPNAPKGLIGMHVDQTSPAGRRVALAAGKDGAYRSDDGGLTWAKASKGLPWTDITGFCGGSDAKSGKVTAYCVIPIKKQGGKYVGGVYRTSDRGATWEPAMGRGIRTAVAGRADRLTFIAQPENMPQTVLTTNRGTEGAPPNHYTVYRSDNAGRTWREIFFNDPRWPQNNTRCGWLTYDRSRGFGAEALGFGVNAGTPDQVFVTNYGEVFLTMNAGKSWRQVFSRRVSTGPLGRGQKWTSCGLEDTTCWRYVFDPHDKSRTYICYTDIGFARSEDRGRSWLYDARGRPCTNTTYDLAADPDVPGRFWGAFSDMHDIPVWRYVQGPGRSKGAIAVSTDHCKTWKVSGRGIPRAPCTSVVLDPTSPKGRRVLYAAVYGHGVYKSADGGKSWVKKSAGIVPEQNRQVYSIRRFKDGTLFCTVAGRRSGRGVSRHLTGGLYVSADGAESWKRISPEAVFRPVDFCFDPDNKDVIYLAVMDGLGHTGGVYKTTDGGAKWDLLKIEYDKKISSYIEGMTVQLNPRNKKVVYFSTHTHGMYLSKDAGRTWSTIGPLKSPPFGNCIRMTWDPDDAKTVYILTFGGGVWKGPDPGQ